MLKELFQIFGTVTINNQDANKALDNTTEKGKQTAKALSSTFETIGKIFTNVGKLATSAGKVCVAATTGIVVGLSSAISRFDTLNNYPKVLSNLGFSAEDAKNSIDTLSKGIDGLPTALDDAASGVQRLVAKNNDINKSTKYFLAMNDAIVAGNAPAEQQASTIEQLTQAYSKGKPDLMEWRTLMMAMPGQLKQVATAMGYIDTDALYEALKEGKISMDDFMDTIVKLDEEGAEGIISFQEQAKNSCDSIGTSITNVSNRFKKGFATILTSMNEAAQNTSFGSIAGMINNLSTSIKNFLDKIGGAVKENKAFNTFMNQIANAITKLNDKINNLSSEQLDKIVTAIINLTKAGPILLVVGKGFSILSGGFNALGKGTKVIEGLNSKILNTSNSILTWIGNNDKLKSNLAGLIVSGFMKINMALDTVKGKVPMLTSILSNVSSGISGTFSKFTDAISGAFPNVTAGLSKITGAFGGLFSKIGSSMGSFLPIFTKCFNITAIIGLVIAGLGLLQSQFGEQINSFLSMVTQNGSEIIINLVNGIVSKLPDLIAKGGELLQNLLTAIIANLPAIIQGGIQIISSLVIGIAQQLPALIPMALEAIITIVTSLLDNVDLLIDAAIELIMGLADGLIQALPILIEKAPIIIQKLLNALIRNAPKIIQAAWELITKLASGIINCLPKLAVAAGQIIDTIWNVLKSLPRKALQWGKDMMQGMIDGIKGMIGKIGDAVTGVGNKIKSLLHFSRPDEGPLRDYETWMPDMVNGLSKTLENSSSKLYSSTKKLAKNISEQLDFSNSDASITGNIVWKNNNIDIQPSAYQISSSNMYKNKESQNGEKSVILESLVQKLIDILLAYFPQFTELMEKDIVLEDGTIAGKLTPYIDKNLSDEETKRKRGN